MSVRISSRFLRPLLIAMGLPLSAGAASARDITCCGTGGDGPGFGGPTDFAPTPDLGDGPGFGGPDDLAPPSGGGGGGTGPGDFAGGGDGDGNPWPNGSGQNGGNGLINTPQQAAATCGQLGGSRLIVRRTAFSCQDDNGRELAQLR